MGHHPVLKAEERLELYHEKLDNIKGLKEELKSHIAALPDIPVVRDIFMNPLHPPHSLLLVPSHLQHVSASQVLVEGSLTMTPHVRPLVC